MLRSYSGREDDAKATEIFQLKELYLELLLFRDKNSQQVSLEWSKTKPQ